MSLFAELKRRSIFRVAIGYIGASWLVLQVIDVLFDIYGVDESIAQIVINVLVIGFVPAMVLGWAFEWTPDGIKRDSQANREAPGMQALDRKLDRAVIAVLALAVGFFAFDKFVISPDVVAEREAEAEERGRTQALLDSYGSRSIAVMPFENMSPDPDQAYFADGISAELLNLLAQVHDLRVISKVSVDAVKDLGLSAPELGDRLNVEHVLEGSVRRSGNEVRVTAQLNEASTGTQLWSKNYDRELVDIFDIQDEIAALVVDEIIAGYLGEIPGATRTDPTVLTLFLQAQRAASGEDGPRRARALIEEALRIDPDYIPALWALRVTNYLEARDPQPFDPERYERAVKANDQLDHRMITAAPTNAYALFAAGWNAFEIQKDFQKAANYVERAIAAGLGDEGILQMSSLFALYIGRHDVSIRLKQLAAERNPECPICINIWNNYHDAKLYDDAIATWLAYAGETRFASNTLVTAALLKGDFGLALEYAPRCNWERACMAMALHSLGRSDEAMAELELQRALPDEEGNIVVSAMATLWLGDEEGALDLLYERYWPHTYLFHRYLLNPIWEPLHDHPRWIALRDRSGHSEAAYASIQFEPVLPEFAGPGP